MDHPELFNLLRETFGETVILEWIVTGGEEEKDKRDSYILVKIESLPEVSRFLKDDPRAAFDLLHCVSAVEWPDYFESVYHLFSMKYRHWARLKVRTSKSQPSVPSVASIWPAANWHEREAYDLMGIVYEGHPDLRRILLPDEWEGHPLRKDYQTPTHERLREIGL